MSAAGRAGHAYLSRAPDINSVFFVGDHIACALVFSSPGQRPSELLQSLGVCRRRPLLTIFQNSSPLDLLDRLEPNLI